MGKVLKAFFVSCIFTSPFFSIAQKACTAPEIHERTKKDLKLNHVDSTNSRGMADNYYLWPNGATIKIKFLSGSVAKQNQVKEAASEWLKFANIKYQWVTQGPANIRIKLGKNNGHNSYIGTVCDLISEDRETMNLDTADLSSPLALRGTVMHEFGHALGLLHEHSSPVSGIQWNKDTIYKNYYKWYGWDKAKVDFQVFRNYLTSYTNGTAYDSKSIMHYSIDPWETKDGYSVPWNYYLSTGDKELIAALYPKKGPRKNDVARVAISNFTKLDMKENKTKGGISIFPTFDLAASGKAGDVYVLAEFFDMYGESIEDSDGEYSFNNRVATYRYIRTLPGKKYSYNKTKKDFELFIPYDQIELPYDDEYILVRFRVIQFTQDYEIKEVFYGKPATYSLKAAASSK